MRKLAAFATRILSLRLAIISLSLAQTTLWAAALGTAGFGLVATLLSAQALLCLCARFGADNILVRLFRADPDMKKTLFLDFLASALLASALLGVAGLGALYLVVFRSQMETASLIFPFFLVAYNASTILSRVILAQKRLVLVSLVGGVLPLAISVGLFALTFTIGKIPVAGHYTAIGYLTIGYGVSAVVFAVLLRGYLAECFVMRPAGFRPGLLLGPEQWYFLGYQSMSMMRGHGVTLVIAAVFGPAVTGVFALAFRFGSMLTYLNEPARMFVMPRVAEKTRQQLRTLYHEMLVMNAMLGLCGSALLVGVYLSVELPFPTDPPFPLYTVIIMGGALVNLLVGPVGAILAMSGNERNNFFANAAGLAVTLICVVFAVLFRAPIVAVCGVALSSASVNLINTVSLMRYLTSGGDDEPTR